MSTQEQLARTAPAVATIQAGGLKLHVAAVVLVGLGPFMLLLMPVFVGAISRELGFSARELGYVASAELAGITLISMFAALWLGRVSNRAIAAAGMLLMASANVICIFAASAPAFIACRLLAGIGGGALLALGTTLIAAQPKPDRLYAFAIALQVSSAAVAMYALPVVFDRGGMSAGLSVLASVPLALLPLVSCLPAGRSTMQAPRLLGQQRNSAALQVLLSTLVFSLGVGGVWTYAEQLGTASGLQRDFLSSTLASAMIVSFAGAMFASWLEARTGRRLPLLLGMLGQSAGLVLLGGELSEPVFVLGVLAFNLFWSFVGPYQLGVLSSVDRSGKYAALLPGFQGLGFAVGPAIAAEVLVRSGYTAVIVMGVACLLASLALILPQTLAPHRSSHSS